MAMVDDSQRMMTGVDLQDEGFGQSVERDLLRDLLLLGLCMLCVVLGFPQSLAGESVVQGLGFLLQRCTLPKMMFQCLKCWATKVAPRE